MKCCTWVGMYTPEGLSYIYIHSTGAISSEGYGTIYSTRGGVIYIHYRVGALCDEGGWAIYSTRGQSYV